MRLLIQPFFNRQFPLFVATGGIAACVNYGSRFAYDIWFSFSTAILFAYVTGMITAYVLARLLVFEDTRNSTVTSASWFVVVNLFAVAQTWLVSIGLAYYALPAMGVERLVPEIAHFFGVIFPVFTSFLGHKYLSFRT